MEHTKNKFPDNELTGEIYFEMDFKQLFLLEQFCSFSLPRLKIQTFENQYMIFFDEKIPYFELIFNDPEIHVISFIIKYGNITFCNIKYKTITTTYYLVTKNNTLDFFSYSKHSIDEKLNKNQVINLLQKNPDGFFLSDDSFGFYKFFLFLKPNSFVSKVTASFLFFNKDETHTYEFTYYKPTIKKENISVYFRYEESRSLSQSDASLEKVFPFTNNNFTRYFHLSPALVQQLTLEDKKDKRVISSTTNEKTSICSHCVYRINSVYDKCCPCQPKFTKEKNT